MSYNNNSKISQGNILNLSGSSVTISGSLTGSEISGTVTQFTTISASVISASQYIGPISGTGGSGTPGGTNQTIQFNSGSQFSGSTNLIYDYENDVLSGTQGQFVVISGTTISGTTISASDATGSTATFTTIFSTDIVASTITGNLSALVTAVTTITGSTTLDYNQHVLLVSSSAADITLTLPAAGTSPFQHYIIKKIDATAFKTIISGSSGETIDGNLGRQVNVQYESLSIVSDGVNSWYIL